MEIQIQPWKNACFLFGAVIGSLCPVTSLQAVQNNKPLLGNRISILLVMAWKLAPKMIRTLKSKTGNKHAVLVGSQVWFCLWPNHWTLCYFLAAQDNLGQRKTVQVLQTFLLSHLHCAWANSSCWCTVLSPFHIRVFVSLPTIQHHVALWIWMICRQRT